MLPLLLALAAPNDAPALLHQPDLHGDTVVFVHQRDLWSAPIDGGTATRLTVDDGAEQRPRFSPDGSQIAFTGELDGNVDVYVMQRDGSDVRRVTWHPDADRVVDWNADGTRLLFQSGRASFSRFLKLFSVAPDGTQLEELPIHEAAWGSMSPDGSHIAYNRAAREHRTWKRYRGGLAQDLWIYNFRNGEDRQLTTYLGTDRNPMWHRGKWVYFTSDRTFQLNLHRIDVSTGEVDAVTFHNDFDVLQPSLGDNDRIVYAAGGQLHVFDIARGESTRLAINVPSDPKETRPFHKTVAGDVTQASIAPDGSRLLVVARGEVFSVPRAEGVTRNLTRSSGAREKDAVWSPDAQWVAYTSDESGECELWVRDAKGRAVARKLTTHESGYRHTLRWSPDSRSLAYADHTLRFHVLDVASGEIRTIDRSSSEPVDIGIDHKPIHDFAWSPCSRWITYSKIDSDLVSKIYLHDLEARVSHCLSHGLYHDFEPCFVSNGQDTRVVFVSNRRFVPTFCDFEWEMVYKDVASLYAVNVTGHTPLFPPANAEAAGSGVTNASSTPGAGARPRLDLENIASRTEPLPVPAGNYRHLRANASHLFFLNGTKGDYNRFEYRGPGDQALHAMSLADGHVHPVVDGVEAFDVSVDGKWIAHRAGSKVGVVASSAKNAPATPLDLSALTMHLDPRAEWRQIFDEAWRMERDFFYEPAMHGLDWDATGEMYRSLLAGATCRDDLRFLVGELIGELNASHTYVMGGDARKTATRVRTGLLGADWGIDGDRYVVRRVLRTPDWTNETWPPLAAPGIDVQPGDRLLAVDGRRVTTSQNLYAAFEGLAGRTIEVAFERPDATGSPRDRRRVFLVTPLGSERTLRYRDWVEGNRRKVNELSNGALGYLHLPDTYQGSATEFPPYFYGQTQKQGLLVDGRFNGGGLDPDIFLQRLDKKVMTWWTRRQSMPQTTPYMVTRAHLCCLTNKYAGSGGDMLPMEFQMKGMGPVVGTRTWGGLVGVSMFLGLIDGGGLTAPDYRIYCDDDSAGGTRWIVENEGVMPDVWVDLSPKEVAAGHDAQLHKGVELLLEAIAREPRPVPSHPAFPDESGR